MTVEKALAILNQSNVGHSAELAKVADMVQRGETSGANYVAANSRELILDAQATINRCQVTIPTLKLELKQHKLKCEHELTEMNKRLAIVLGDIEVMTNILEMTDCDAQSATSTQSQAAAQSGFLQNGQVTFHKCTDQCTHKTFIEFNHKVLQEKMKKLKSETSHSLMHEALSGLVDGVKGLEVSYELLQDQESSNQTSSLQGTCFDTKVFVTSHRNQQLAN